MQWLKERRFQYSIFEIQTFFFQFCILSSRPLYCCTVISIDWIVQQVFTHKSQKVWRLATIFVYFLQVCCRMFINNYIQFHCNIKFNAKIVKEGYHRKKKGKDFISQINLTPIRKIFLLFMNKASVAYKKQCAQNEIESDFY